MQVEECQLKPDDLVWKVGSHQNHIAGRVKWLFPQTTDSRLDASLLAKLSAVSKEECVASVKTEVATRMEAVVEPPKPECAGASDRSGKSVMSTSVAAWREIALMTTRHACRLMVAAVKVAQGRAPFGELIKTWPADDSESRRLMIGYSVGFVGLILACRMWAQVPLGPQHVSAFQPAARIVSPSDVWIQEKKSEEKIQAARSATEIERLLSRAADLRAEEKFHAAADVYKQALTLAPQNAEAHAELAATLFSLKEPAMAVASLWRAFDNVRDNTKRKVDLVIQIAEYHFEHEEYDAAIRAFDKAISLVPEEGAYRLAAGVASIHGKNYRKAVNYLEAAIEYFQITGQTGSWEYKAYLHLATAHRHLGETSKAAALCDNVLAKDPRNIDAHCVRGVMHAEDSETESAIKELDFVANHPECSRTMLESFGEAFRKGRNWSACSLVYSRLMKLEPNAHEWIHMRAVMRMRTGQLEDADVDCQRALAMVRENDAQMVPLRNLRAMIDDLKTSGMTYDEYMTAFQAQQMKQSIGPEAFFPSSPAGAPATGSPNSPYDYLTPHQAGKLGAMGLQIVPGQYFRR